MHPEFFLVLAGYLVALLAVGLKFSRKMKNLEGFFLASRALSTPLVFLSLTASWFGATSIIVTADEAYRAGLSALWLVGVPAAATVLFLAAFLSGPIRRLDVQTLPGLVEARYGKTVRHLASLLILWYMIVLASSQIVALEHFLRPFLGLSSSWSLVLGITVVLIYLIRGGLFSVTATDVLQCLLLATGIVVLSVSVARGSPAGAVFELIDRTGRSGYFDFFHDGQRNALIALSFFFAWTISPIAWQRIQAAGSVRKARGGLLMAAAAFALLYSLVVFIGLRAVPLFSARTLSHPLLTELISSQAGIWVGGLLFIAVVAAVLSTMDTAINTGAMTLIRDIYYEFSGRHASDSQAAVMAGRMATFFVALAALGIATRFQSILQTLGLASEIMAEGLFVPGMAMFVFRKKRPLAGGLSLLLGGGFAMLGFLSALRVLHLTLPPWPRSVPYGVALSIFGFASGFLLDKLLYSRPKKAAQ